jgi:Nuclease-related domain
MANKRRQHNRACRCERADAGCAALAVQRLSRARVQELAEEIWTVTTGTSVPLQPVPDPRGSRPGASAMAAYRRYRHKEHERWRRGWRSRSAVVATVALGVWLLVGLALGPWLGWRTALLAAVLAWWRLRFYPSASARLWRRQAQVQRRTAGALAQLEQEGYLVLHDIALPGWSASLDHLVIGPTGAWAIESRLSSWLPRRRPATAPRPARGGIRGPRPDLSWKAQAIADSLAGTGIPVQPLLCRHVGLRQHSRRPVQGIPQVGLRSLLDVLRYGSRVRPVTVERASARALEVLRPAA